MSLTSAPPLPALGAIAVLSLGLSACGTFGDTTAPRAQITLRVADAAMNSGAPGLALRVADIVLAKQPDNAAALTARGDALYAMGQLELAGQAYRAAVKVDPRFAGAQLGLGRVLIRTDPKAAEAAFLAATTLQPGNAVALSNLGVARDLQKHHAAAQQAYRVALALAPEMTDVRVNLGLSLALSGQADAAVQILRPLASDPGATQVWHADLAVALAQSGDLAGARRALVAPDEGAPAPEPTAVTLSDPPVAVPAPLTAVAQRDMPAPDVAHAAPETGHPVIRPAPEVAYATGPVPSEVTRMAAPVPPEVTGTVASVSPAVTGTAAPAPLEVSHTAAPAAQQAALLPAQAVARVDTAPATASARAGTAPAANAVRVDKPAASTVWMDKPTANALRADQAAEARPSEAAPTSLLAAMVTTEQGVAPLPPASSTSSAPVTVAATDLPAPIDPAKAPAPAVAHADTSPASPAVRPVAVNPKPMPAPAPMVVAAAAIRAPVLTGAPQVAEPAVVHAAPASAPPRHAAAMALPSATHPGWTPWLQLAAVRSEHDVQYEWHRLQTRLPELLGGHTLTVSQGEAHDHVYWRLRTGGFASVADANALCLRIRSAGGNCFAVVTSGS